jgi:Rieske Fe-S protein
MSGQSQTRREFCSQACGAASLAAFGGALGSVLQGCGGTGGLTGNIQALPVIAGTVSNNAVTLTIDSSSPLSAVGSAALVQISNGYLLVAHTAQDSFSALSGICTHQACTITGYGNGTFVCPCHGSQFDTSGHVISGPAFAPLAQYHTQFANNVLTITA